MIGPLSIRFIGHKEHLLPHIRERYKTLHRPQFVADLFCGTATVSREFRELGARVPANDILLHCTIMAKALLLIDGDPAFSSLVRNIPDLDSGRHATLSVSNYGNVIMYLNSLPDSEGFFYKNYCPGGTRALSYSRRYFTDENGKRIDSIRNKIRVWWSTG